MDDLDLQFLIACHESVICRRPLLADLAAFHGVRADELFYLWAERGCKQRGTIRGGEWTYFFHGCECDLDHAEDGRFLRIDFGPHGRTDAFTSWGVAQFVMTSKHPWPEFPDLQTFLAIHPPPYNERSVTFDRETSLSDRLQAAGFIESADPELLALAERYTSLNDDGLSTLCLPPGTPDRTFLDILVARRKVITESGKRRIALLTSEALAQQ